MRELMSLDEMMARMERALASSPAESTEIAWVEAWRARVATGAGRDRTYGLDASERGERSLQIRVRQSGRTGFHRTADVGASDLENAVRAALAQARLAPASPSEPLAGGGGGTVASGGGTSGTGAGGTGGTVTGAGAGAGSGVIGTGGTSGAGSGAIGAGGASWTPGGAVSAGGTSGTGGATETGSTIGAGGAGGSGGATGSGASAGGTGGSGVGAGEREDGRLHDPELAELEPARARDVLERAAGRGERLRLSWLAGRVAIVNSAGLRRTVEVTAASFEASCGRRAGAGSAIGAARRLDALDIAGTLARARARHAGGGASGGGDSDPAGSRAAGESATFPAALSDLPADAMLVLSEQAAATLVDLLNRQALSPAALHDGGSWLRGKLGEPLFAPCLSLRDDGTDPRALPFPFDLAGWPKRPIDLVVEGVFTSPAIDPRLARELGRQPTPHALGADEWLPANLLLLPGKGTPLSEPELLALAGNGIWIGAITNLECFDPRSLRFRAQARGVRRIAAGALGPPLPDLLWEDTLPAVLGRAQAIGNQPVAIPTGDLLFGATAAPLLAVKTAMRFTV
jgi:predicted Zn-dependent protease